MRIYDPRIGRFLSTDPISSQYPELTPYQFASNDPINLIDIDGLEGSVPMGGLIDPEAGQKLGNAVGNFFNEMHSRGMHNLKIAEEARSQAVKQGRQDGDGIDWRTKTAVYLAPYWFKLAPYSDANDASVLLKGKNTEGSAATKIDYVAAGVGLLLPEISGSAIKKALSGPIHHVFTNKNFKRGEKWSEQFLPLFEKAGYKLDDALNKVSVLGHKGPHPNEYHQAVFDRLIRNTEGLEGDAYKKLLNKRYLI